MTMPEEVNRLVTDRLSDLLLTPDELSCGTPCLTLRWNTERPVTLREHGGAGVLVGNQVDRIRKAYKETLSSERKPVRPELWDRKTAERCLRAILNH